MTEATRSKLLLKLAENATVRGRVIDAQSGAAVELARVVVTGSGQRTRRTITAADVRFSVRLRRGGTVWVQRFGEKLHSLRTAHELTLQ
jgi:hypothetical protein